MSEDKDAHLITVDELELAPERILFLVHPEGEPELRQTERGDLFAFVYSSVELLVEACGPGQPFVQLERADVERLCRRLELTMVAVDVVHPEGHRYPEPDVNDFGELPFAPAPDADGDRLYVPSRPIRHGDRQVRIELQPDEAGRPTLLAYTSIQALYAGCGPNQPTAVIWAEDLEHVAEKTGAAQVLFDPVLAEQSRHTAPVLDWGSRSAIGDDQP